MPTLNKFTYLDYVSGFVVERGPIDELSLKVESGHEYVTSSGSEELLYQQTVDFNKLDPALTALNATFTALTKQSAGPGTYFLRVGGTVNAADGTIFATLVATHNAGFVSIPDNVVGPSTARPTGQQLVKITGASSAPGNLAFIRSFEVLFT